MGEHDPFGRVECDVAGPSEPKRRRRARTADQQDHRDERDEQQDDDGDKRHGAARGPDRMAVAVHVHRSSTCQPGRRVV